MEYTIAELIDRLGIVQQKMLVLADWADITDDFTLSLGDSNLDKWADLWELREVLVLELGVAIEERLRLFSQGWALINIGQHIDRLGVIKHLHMVGKASDSELWEATREVDLSVSVAIVDGKTFGDLVAGIVGINHEIFDCLDRIHDPSTSMEEKGTAALESQKLNVRRVLDYVNVINKLFGYNSTEVKVYKGEDC